jgi:hypothetical protein
MMKFKIIAISIAFLLIGNMCFAQPGNTGMKPPGIEERLKMVYEKICQPLKLDKSQKEKVLLAFNDFFVEMDKSAKPPEKPEKSKVDALSKIRDEKVKQAIPATLYTKYLELEMTTRPKEPKED